MKALRALFIALLFLATPLVRAQTTTVHAVVGQKVTFTAAAKGSQPFTYKWYRNGNLLPNKAATLVIPKVARADWAIYKVVISNKAGAVTTPAVFLMVLRS